MSEKPGELKPAADDAFFSAKLIYIATRRKDGTQSAATPVWFIAASGGRLLVQTRPTSWTARRVAREPRALIRIGGPRGPLYLSQARLSTDPEVFQSLIAGLPPKYWLAWLGFYRPSALKFSQGRTVAVELTPLCRLGDEFPLHAGEPFPQWT